MRNLTDRQLLAAWERGAAEPPWMRAMALLGAGGSPGDDPAGLSVGRRDERLLALRERLLGPDLAALIECPACGDTLEVDLRIDDLHGQASAAPGPDALGGLSVEWEEYLCRLRLPTTRDIGAVVGRPDAVQQLLARCVLAATLDGRPVDPAEFPEPLVRAIEECLAGADPLAEINLGMTCPRCSHTWQALLDVVSFVWAEAETRALRLLDDVHTLARAYGWSERAILGLSPRRRQAYLEIIRG
jgi:hypothetical protein